MRYFITLLAFVSIISCTGKRAVVDKAPIVPIEEINKIEDYVNDIESFVHHINISTKDFDSISVNELNTIKNSRHFTKNISQKNLIYRNGKIVKVKYRDFLENNFIKIKSFYYNDDDFVCVKIYELLPTVDRKNKVYSRKIYFKENSLLYDSNLNDKKYENKSLHTFAIQKLEEEYQSKK
jgi:hypothetical protein